MIAELREYQVKPGMRDEWVEYMRSTIVPFQQAHGMTVLGQFVTTQSEDAFVWIRAFNDEAEMTRLSDAVYGSTEWMNEIAPMVSRYLVRGGARITLLDPIEVSGGRWTEVLGDALDRS